MLLSIIIPAHNIAPYIDECLGSILSQAPFEYEVIIVENASSDNTLTICKEHAQRDARINVYHLTEPGVSNARNFGLSHAKGDYVWFIDGDDYIHESALNNLAKYLKSDSQSANPPDIFIFGYNILKNGNCEPKPLSVKGDLLMKEAVNGLFNASEWSGFVWNKIYKRSSIGYTFHTGIHMVEDLLFNTQVFLSAQRISCIDEELYYYRINDASISSHFSEKKLTSFEAYCEILTNLKKGGSKSEDYSFPIRIISCAKVDFSRQILMHYFNNDKKKYKSIRKYYTQIIKENINSYPSFKSKLGGYLTIYAPFLLNTRFFKK